MSSVMLPSLSGTFLPHNCSLRAIIVDMSCSRMVGQKGPVPWVLRTVCVSSRACVFCGWRPSFAYDHLQSMV